MDPGDHPRAVPAHRVPGFELSEARSRIRCTRNDAPVSFKRLSPGNWREADPVSTQFWRNSRLVGPIAMDGHDWARTFLAVELKGHVPESIRDLFDVARGALVYGWFFYPLFRLGEDQLHRVVEAAAAARYQQVV